MVTNEILRKNAREQLGNHIFKEKWLTMLVVCVLSSMIVNAATTLFGEMSVFAMLPALLRGDSLQTIKVGSGISLFSTVVTLVLTGPFTYGLAKIMLANVEGDKWGIANLFDGFRECFVKSMLLGFLQSLFIALWSLLFFIPGLVKSYSYALAFYVQRNDKELEAIDCINESKRLMQGHKWQLFCLDLSFIGWYLLGALCFGVGVYFVLPYHEMARANFYEALIAENE